MNGRRAAAPPRDYSIQTNPRPSDLLDLDLLQDIAFEVARTAEKPDLRHSHHVPFLNPTLDQMQCADKIRQLEESVIGGMYALCKLHALAQFFDKRLVQKIRHGRLAAIVIDLDGLDIQQVRTMSGDEIDELPFESLNNLIEVVDELLVHGQTVVLKRNLLGKGHHAGEDTTTPFTAHDLVALFLADQRSRMKAMPLEPDLRFSLFKIGNALVNRMILIMENKAKDVEARIRVGILKASRFIDKYAERFP